MWKKVKGKVDLVECSGSSFDFLCESIKFLHKINYKILFSIFHRLIAVVPTKNKITDQTFQLLKLQNNTKKIPLKPKRFKVFISNKIYHDKKQKQTVSNFMHPIQQNYHE